MSIVTRTGDDGTTGLLSAHRVPKDHPRITAIGTVDECNTLLGVIVAQQELPDAMRERLLNMQHALFTLGADLAAPDPSVTVARITPEHLRTMEAWIADVESSLPPLTQFILPGGTPVAARLHHARAVCRRAERNLVTLARTEWVNPHAIVELNRLSDFLFLLARAVNREAGKEESPVQYGANG